MNVQHRNIQKTPNLATDEYSSAQEATMQQISNTAPLLNEIRDSIINSFNTGRASTFTTWYEIGRKLEEASKYTIDSDGFDTWVRNSRFPFQTRCIQLYRRSARKYDETDEETKTKVREAESWAAAKRILGVLNDQKTEKKAKRVSSALPLLDSIGKSELTRLLDVLPTWTTQLLQLAWSRNPDQIEKLRDQLLDVLSACLEPTIVKSASQKPNIVCEPLDQRGRRNNEVRYELGLPISNEC